jgi:hypothetical protein
MAFALFKRERVTYGLASERGKFWVGRYLCVEW